MVNILYLGDDNESSSSLHRANALKRLGHSVTIQNFKKGVYSKHTSGLLGAFNYRTGFRFIQSKVVSWLKQVLKTGIKPDVIWIDSGEFFGINCMKILKTLNCPILLYNLDDPTGNRDGGRFDSLLKSIKYYDLCVVVREENVNEFKIKGAKSVLHLFRSYDEIAHKPYSDLSEIPERFKSEVVFIGTWMKNEKRDEFIIKLIEQGLDVSIWGPNWLKSPFWNEIKPFHKGDAIYNREYIAAVQGSKICIGLLSKGNRDLHTQRSLEIPFAGGLFCAERTTEHQKLYKEGKEAIFWSDAEECASVCKALLADKNKLEEIRLAGMRKVRELHVGNEDTCKKILEETFKSAISKA